MPPLEAIVCLLVTLDIKDPFLPLAPWELGALVDLAVLDLALDFLP